MPEPTRLRPYLENLERRIDPAVDERLQQEWADFAWGRFDGDLFHPKRQRNARPEIQWPKVSINAALDNYELMALYQLKVCSEWLAEGSGSLLNVRCNYGTGILPSLFGLEIFVMDEELETLPTTRPLNDLDAVQRILDRGVPDLSSGYGRQVLEMGERFAEWFKPYPKVEKFVRVFHPDLQGPMDVCELIFGSTIFYTLYDRPEMVHSLLELVTGTYSRFLDAWLEIHPFDEGANSHWGLFYRGSIMLRDDSAMNLSAEMVDEFVLPYDQRLLKRYGGGSVHFCGKGDHFIRSLGALEGLSAINLSQPELNDMELVFSQTVDRGINLLELQGWAARKALEAGRDLRGRVHITERS
jgi:hypothetical protein